MMARSPREAHARLGQGTRSLCVLVVVHTGSCVKLTGGSEGPAVLEVGVCRVTAESERWIVIQIIIVVRLY